MEPPLHRQPAHRRAPDSGRVSARRNRSRAKRSARMMSVIVAVVVSALVGAVVAIRVVESHDTMVFSNDTNGPLFGVSASNPGALAQTTGQFGHMPIVRVFYPGLPSGNAWSTGAPGLNRSAVIVSFKAQAQTILSGADDAVLRHFFDTAPTGHPIYYSYYPEPERYIAAGLFTVSEYKAAWTHIVALADAANNPDLQSTLILTSYDLSPQSGRNWKDYLAGGGVISTLGWDAYPAGTVEDKNPQATPPADFMGAAVAAAKSAGLPFGFAEFALATTNGRPSWLTDVGNYLASSGALFGTYFDSAGFAGMQLTDSPSISAWRSVIARSGTDVPADPQRAAKGRRSVRGPGDLRRHGDPGDLGCRQHRSCAAQLRAEPGGRRDHMRPRQPRHDRPQAG